MNCDPGGLLVATGAMSALGSVIGLIVETSTVGLTVGTVSCCSSRDTDVTSGASEVVRTSSEVTPEVAGIVEVSTADVLGTDAGSS